MNKGGETVHKIINYTWGGTHWLGSSVSSDCSVWFYADLQTRDTNRRTVRLARWNSEACMSYKQKTRARERSTGLGNVTHYATLSDVRQRGVTTRSDIGWQLRPRHRHRPAAPSCFRPEAPVASGTVGPSRHEASRASPATSASSGTMFSPVSSFELKLDGAPTGLDSSVCNESQTAVGNNSPVNADDVWKLSIYIMHVMSFRMTH